MMWSHIYGLSEPPFPLSAGIIGVTEVMLWNVLSSLGWDLYDEVPVLSEEVVCILISEREVHDHVFALLPVSRSSNLVVGGELERINDTNDFIEVASRRGRVRHHQGNGPIWLEDKDGANRHGQTLGVFVGFVQDSKLDSMFTVWIAKEWKGHITTSDDLNILDPFFVALSTITGISAKLDTASDKLVCEVGSSPKFCSTNWSEIARVHKDATPRATKVLVEVKAVRILGGALKIWELFVDSWSRHNCCWFVERVTAVVCSQDCFK
mmetsp:Transcript_10896/g.18063  ORF Transcript_10896/g.18063 Transcript_10896/m.18063 type:complete len:266 (-) Transcript_10896:157-954(-)